MPRPRTNSKPRKKNKSNTLVKTVVSEGKELVRFQGATGENVPDSKAKEILMAHVGGMAVTRIARAYNTSYHTICALIRNRPEMLAKAREVTAANWKTIAAVGTAEILERVPDMKDSGLVIMSAIATEKAELLSGGATQRVEHTMQPAADDWSDFVSGLRPANGTILDAEAVALPLKEPETGSRPMHKKEQQVEEFE